MPNGRKRLLGMAAVVAALVLLVVAIALICTREIPADPIESPGDTFASQTMYVSPQGQEGSSEGSDGDDNQQQQDSKQSDKLDEKLDQLDTGSGTSGGSSGTGNGGSGNGEGHGQSDTPTSAGISTNIGEFESLSTKTRAPNPLGFSPSTRSGFDQSNDLLWFYAAPNSLTPDGYSVKVEYSSSLTGGSFIAADASEHDMYSIKVQKSDGDKTNVRMTLITQSGTATNIVANFTIEYNGRKAPTIEVNLTQGQVIETDNYDLYVKAYDCDGSAIYNDNVEVYLDGEKQQSSGGDPIPYTLDVAKNMTGDDTEHTVVVKATDYSAEKASTTLTYQIIYRHVPYGAEIGTAYMTIDATTVGLDVVDSFEVTLHKGYPFAYDMLQAMDSRGYGVESKGPSDSSDPESSGWSDFYLSRLSGSMFSGQDVPERLWNKIQDDKINLSGVSSSNSLGEVDYTSLSGWIYVVNGTSYAKSLGGYTPVDGDNVTLIFEIAGGKEVGYPTQSAGALSTYNATWIGGKETLNYNLTVYQVVEEATCTSEGRARWVDATEYEYDEANGTDTISKYGGWGDSQGGALNEQWVTIPVTDHSWEVDWGRCIEPTETKDGVKAYYCTVCGTTKEETWHWEG